MFLPGYLLKGLGSITYTCGEVPYEYSIFILYFKLSGVGCKSVSQTNECDVRFINMPLGINLTKAPISAVIWAVGLSFFRFCTIKIVGCDFYHSRCT